MDYDRDKVDEMVLALLVADAGGRWPRVEGARLGCAGPAARQGVHLRSEEQGQVGGAERRGRAAVAGTVRAALRTQGLTKQQRQGAVGHHVAQRRMCWSVDTIPKPDGLAGPTAARRSNARSNGRPDAVRPCSCMRSRSASVSGRLRGGA